MFAHRQSANVAVQSSDIRLESRSFALGPFVATKLERAQAQRDHFKRLAFSDDLTGVLNRRGLDREIDRLTSCGIDVLSFAVVDIDDLWSINAAHGRAGGDEVVSMVASTLSASRPSPRRNEDLFFARIGADEFALVASDPERLVEWVLGILGATRSRPWIMRGEGLEVTVSIGVSTEVSISRSPDVWAGCAEALFAAKQQGGDQMVVHDDVSPPLVAQMADRNWASELRHAIRSDGLVLYGQPIFDFKAPGKAPEWFEALVRFRSTTGVLVPPSSFLPAAERVGLLGEIDFWVTEHAIAWLGEVDRATKLAVNVSAEFLSSPRALTHLGRCLEESGVEPERLCVEITESTAISDMNRCQKVVSTLRRWGCQVAIDDFGSGWTSLPIARDLGVDILKIDGTWVSNCVSDKLSNAVVTSVVEVASIIGASVVAEWVEDRDTFEYLSWLGVEYAQGYLMGLPAPLEECAPLRSAKTA